MDSLGTTDDHVMIYMTTATQEEAETIAQALVDTGLTKSLGEARRAVAQGGVYANNAKVDEADAAVGDVLLPGGTVVLRRGKKTLAGVFVE